MVFIATTRKPMSKYTVNQTLNFRSSLLFWHNPCLQQVPHVCMQIFLLSYKTQIQVFLSRGTCSVQTRNCVCTECFLCREAVWCPVQKVKFENKNQNPSAFLFWSFASGFQQSRTWASLFFGHDVYQTPGSRFMCSWLIPLKGLSAFQHKNKRGCRIVVKTQTFQVQPWGSHSRCFPKNRPPFEAFCFSKSVFFFTRMISFLFSVLIPMQVSLLEVVDLSALNSMSHESAGRNQSRSVVTLRRPEKALREIREAWYVKPHFCFALLTWCEFCWDLHS